MSDIDVKTLNQLRGSDFTSDVINEMLKHCINRPSAQSALFRSKAAFLKYMSKIIESLQGNKIKAKKHIKVVQAASIAASDYDNGIWGQIRYSYAKSDSRNAAIDYAWLRKCKAEQDAHGNLLVKAPNKFFRDWITNNYLYEIEKIASARNIKLRIS